MRWKTLRRIAGCMLCALGVAGAADRVSAAGSAYQVDTGVVGESGACKVDAWTSAAANRDFIAAVTPTCVLDLTRPVEFSAQLSRSRSDSDWTSAVQPKLKTALIPGGGVREWSVAIAGSAAYDATAREFSSAATRPTPFSA